MHKMIFQNNSNISPISYGQKMNKIFWPKWRSDQIFWPNFLTFKGKEEKQIDYIIKTDQIMHPLKP